MMNTHDPKSWDMVGSLALSQQLTTGRTLAELAEEGNDDIVVCTADLGRPTQVINFGGLNIMSFHSRRTLF